MGSPRVVTDQNGNVVSRRDFLPFGEEILANENNRKAALGYNSGDNLRQKFTGYEKDTETDLEFAQNRYYSNKLGRFTTPDPLMASAEVSDPQTFNRYTYVKNNPLNLVDPDGLMSCDPRKEPCPNDDEVIDISSEAFPNLVIREDRTASFTGEDGRTVNFTLAELSDEDFNSIANTFASNGTFNDRQVKLLSAFANMKGQSPDDGDNLDHPEPSTRNFKGKGMGGGGLRGVAKDIGRWLGRKIYGKPKKAKAIRKKNELTPLQKINLKGRVKKSGMTPRQAGDFFGWSNAPNYVPSKTVNNFTRQSLVENGWTKEVISDVAAGYREVARVSPNPSAIPRSEQLESLLKLFD